MSGSSDSQGGARIIITTSRRPSPRTRSLVKDLTGVIPGSLRLTRGHYNYKDLASEAAAMGADRVVIIGEKRGNPSIIRIYQPRPGQGLENIVTLIIKGVKLSREAGNPSSAPGKRLAVEHDGSEVALDMAEALIQGLHARLRAPHPRVTIHLKALDVDEAEARFTYNGSPVGPVLRLGKPWRMIKSAQGEV